MIASLGGFLGRKGDGEPGPQPCGEVCSVSNPVLQFIASCSPTSNMDHNE